MRPILSAIDLPPVWLLAHLALAWAISFIPLKLFGAAGVCFGSVLLGLGVTLMAAAIWAMSRARTTVIPRRDPAALVTSGVFGYSRNPIYLADTMILTGAILWWDAALALPLVAVFAWIIQTRFIKDEEARLTAGFGPEFDLWAQRVHRWFGRK
ncbi:isoprenylcysteine carboxylmethyltransferase family protein [Tabrizicola sp.]|uniref:methyltransferase family protein n=1 Tax=Tabrizicola sp. TaxID=2005166 RepID=UPI00286B48ED|nr:isoprenylcysteine carboxylmethyltransferase family protein [Tabrizicola sp.]